MSLDISEENLVIIKSHFKLKPGPGCPHHSYTGMVMKRRSAPLCILQQSELAGHPHDRIFSHCNLIKTVKDLTFVGDFLIHSTKNIPWKQSVNNDLSNKILLELKERQEMRHNRIHKG